MSVKSVLVFVIFNLCFAKCKIPQACITPLGQEGVCKSILECQFLKNIAIKETISNKEIHYLRRSACGFQNSTPLVCCPKNGAGTCKPSATPPDPWSGCCGRTATTYFKKGTDIAAIDQYPWMVIIEYHNFNVTKMMCSGTLISSRYVVSMAMCFKPSSFYFGKPMRVWLGEFDTSNQGPDCVVDPNGGSDCTDGAISVPIERNIVHPAHDIHRRVNDIALVMLSEAVSYTDFIRPICLPTMDLTKSPPSNLKLYVAGWGATSSSVSSDLLRHVGLPYVDPKTCQEAYRTPPNKATLTNGHVCAGGESGRDSCKGDYGAPLIYNSGPYVEAIGLVNFGSIPCGVAKVPSVYTKIFAYDKWIRENIELLLFNGSTLINPLDIRR